MDKPGADRVRTGWSVHLDFRQDDRGPKFEFMKVLFNNFGPFTTIFSIQNLKMSVWFLQIASSSRKNLRVEVVENEHQL